MIAQKVCPGSEKRQPRWVAQVEQRLMHQAKPGNQVWIGVGRPLSATPVTCPYVVNVKTIPAGFTRVWRLLPATVTENSALVIGERQFRQQSQASREPASSWEERVSGDLPPELSVERSNMGGRDMLFELFIGDKLVIGGECIIGFYQDHPDRDWRPAGPVTT